MKNCRYKRLIIFSRLLFLIYLLLMLYFLLFAESFGRTVPRGSFSYNLTPLKEIKRYIEWAKVSDTGMKMMLLNIWGNIICFIPFGFFMPVMFKRLRHGILTFISSFAFSLTVETFQLMLQVGSFDVDDIILNTVGGIIGYISYIIVKKAASVIMEKRSGGENE